MTNLIFSSLLFFYCFQAAQAQIDHKDSLYIALKQQDSLFFEKGFNKCDLQFLREAVAEDLRFYHDTGGFQDKELFLKNTRKNICPKTGIKPIRKLQEGSLEVFPLYKKGVLYGAIQQGVHHFYLREAQKQDRWTGTARFTAVWVLNNGSWKLEEVLSYDHRDPARHVKNGLEALLKKNKVPALGLATIKHGKLQQVAVYGTLDGNTVAPYNTIFKVASLAKPIVALTALKLVDQGLLDLDEPLYPYWTDPDIRKDPRHKQLTPRLVLSHQTGFPNWRYLTPSGKLGFEFDPGTRYQYSGEGFEYLKKAIEKKLGRELEDLAEELVFTPAGMQDTRFWWDAGMDPARYARNFNASGEQLPTVKYYQASAAANLLTTAEDYGKFLVYVLNGAGLTDFLRKEMHKNQVQLGKEDHFVLGWEKLSGFSNGEYALLHTGKDPGVSTLAIMFPESGNGYLVLLNGDNAMPVYETLLNEKLYLGSELWNKR